MLIATISNRDTCNYPSCTGYHNVRGEHISGMKLAMNMTVGILPLLFFSFIVAGMIQVLIPREFLSTWVGEESGIRGICIGTIAGGLAPGGSYVGLTIAAGLLRSGASAGLRLRF